MPSPSSARVVAFAYHDVTDDPRASGLQRPAARAYKLSRRSFGAQMDAIASAGATPALVTGVSLASPGRHVLLTFDDGGRSALDAADELERRGWRGHFFVATGAIGRRAFLDPAGIRELRARGHVVGSHSHSHPDIFHSLSPDAMAAEWRTSREVLADLLGEPCIVASVPGGDISSAVLHSAAPAGLRVLFTSEPWTLPRRVGGCWVLGRYCPRTSTSAARIGDLTRLRGWTSALAMRRAKLFARTALPGLYRRYVAFRTRPFPEPA
jgi:peptidoglycan/xylan/chitin deacetylase (PgdA/CDA1 family)